MINHIVKNGENIDDILKMYNVTLEEVRECNLHLSNLENIMSGAILRIPLINQEIEQILDNTESFVKKYYPKVEEIVSENQKKEAENIQSIPTNEQTKIQPTSKELNRRAYPGIIPPNVPYRRF